MRGALWTLGLVVGLAVTISARGPGGTLPDSRSFMRGEESAEFPQSPARPARQYFTDVVLINQDGKEMRLYSDLLKDKIVLINSFFASCTDSCPAMNATIGKIQERLGDRVGKDIFLISVSVDPEADTPAVLKQYSLRFKAKPGWYFLTGKKQNIQFALKRLGQYVDEKQDHLNIMIIGNERTGLWKKAFGLANPDDIFEIVQSVIADKT